MSRRQLRSWFLIGVVAALSVALFGLVATSPGASAQGGAAVSIVDFAFQPGSVEVPVGSTVTWTNTGAAPHTVTSDSGAFDSGRLAPGTSFSQTFDTAGTFTYHCEIHPNMTGSVVVTEGGGQAAPAAAPSGAQPAPATTRQVPATGVGALTHSAGLPALALLAGLIALFCGVSAVRAYRRA